MCLFLSTLNKCTCNYSNYIADSIIISCDGSVYIVIDLDCLLCYVIGGSFIPKVISSTVDLFKPPHLRSNVVILIAEFMLSFGYVFMIVLYVCLVNELLHIFRYYGLVLWFPLYFKQIEDKSCHGNCTESDSYKDSKSYLDNLYVSLATIPGLLFGIFFINILGSRLLLGEGVLCMYIDISSCEYIIVLYMCTWIMCVHVCAYIVSMSIIYNCMCETISTFIPAKKILFVSTNRIRFMSTSGA